MSDLRTCLKCKSKKHYLEFIQSKKGLRYFHFRCKECLAETRLKCFKCEEFKPFSSFYKDRSVKRGFKHRCHSCRGMSHLETYKIDGNTYFSKNKDEIYLYIKNKKEDPKFKLAQSLRTRLSIAIKRRKWHKNSKLYEYLGCSLEELRLHLESKFKSGMSWENYGDWHIDHIVPLGSAENIENLILLCHFSNLQPLWAIENFKKGDRLQHF